MSDPAVFDLKALRELTDGHAEIETELAQLFCKTAESSLARLETLVSLDEENEWHVVIHEFKGACANIHADVLTKLCQEIENLGKNAQERSAALSALREAYGQLKPLVDALVV